MQFLVKSEPIETNGKILSKYTDDSNRHFHEEIKRNYIRNKSSNIGFKKNKYSLISKLRHDLAQERDLNEKFRDDISSLMFKIKANKQEEEKLLNTIERFKVKFDLLSTNLNSFQSLSDNLVKAQQEIIAFNQKCSNDAHKTKLNLNCIDTNHLPSTESSDSKNTNGK